MKPPLHHRPYGPGGDDYGRDGEMVGRLSYTLEQLDFWHTRALKAEAEAALWKGRWERLEKWYGDKRTESGVTIGAYMKVAEQAEEGGCGHK
jgi:exonuclease V gamma subunit